MDDDSLSPDDGIYDSGPPDSDAESAAAGNAQSDHDTSSIFTNSDPSLPTFDDPNLAEHLIQASEKMLNDASYGIVEVDASGAVVFYNDTESDFSGLDAEEVLGRNFFTSVAPCSNNRLFHGRFQNNRDSDAFDEQFSYTLTYRVSPTLVNVRLLRHKSHTWILINLPENFYSV